MNILMSFILYNPLEAMLLLLPLWYLNRNKINWKTKKYKIIFSFVKDTYILSTIFLMTQIPLNFLYDNILYSLYDMIIVVGSLLLGLYIYQIKRFSKKNFYPIFFIVILYVMSLNIIVADETFCILLGEMSNGLLQEFIANMYIKAIQYAILILIIGGYFMIKNILIKTAKTSIKKEIASTVHGWGEPKLSEKLKKEIKDSEK